jgi:tricorn protease
MIIERLSRKLLGVNYDRNASATGTYPQQVFNGPMVALINETSASDGDIFSYMFKQAKLGPTIGKRTWGGTVGINDYGPVLDGGNVEVPEFNAIADRRRGGQPGHRSRKRRALHRARQRPAARPRDCRSDAEDRGKSADLAGASG